MIVSPTATGCTFTTSVDMLIAYGTSRKAAQAGQQVLDELTAKVRSFVESGIRLATVKDSGEADSGMGESDPISFVEDLP